MPAVTHLTTEELAVRLRRRPQTLANWRSQGRGPRFIPGKPVLYPLAEVEAWERAQTVKNTGEAATRRKPRATTKKRRRK